MSSLGWRLSVRTYAVGRNDIAEGVHSRAPKLRGSDSLCRERLLSGGTGLGLLIKGSLWSQICEEVLHEKTNVQVV